MALFGLIGETVLCAIYEVFGLYILMVPALLLNTFVPERVAIVLTSVLLGVVLVFTMMVLLPEWKTWLISLPIQTIVYILLYFICSTFSPIGFVGPIILFIGFRNGTGMFPTESLLPLFVLEVILLQCSAIGLRYVIRFIRKIKANHK